MSTAGVGEFRCADKPRELTQPQAAPTMALPVVGFDTKLGTDAPSAALSIIAFVPTAALTPGSAAALRVPTPLASWSLLPQTCWSAAKSHVEAVCEWAEMIAKRLTSVRW